MWEVWLQLPHGIATAWSLSISKCKTQRRPHNRNLKRLYIPWFLPYWESQSTLDPPNFPETPKVWPVLMAPPSIFHLHPAILSKPHLHAMLFLLPQAQRHVGTSMESSPVFLLKPQTHMLQVTHHSHRRPVSSP